MDLLNEFENSMDIVTIRIKKDDIANIIQVLHSLKHTYHINMAFSQTDVVQVARFAEETVHGLNMLNMNLSRLAVSLENVLKYNLGRGT